jgi:hypothetical protein
MLCLESIAPTWPSVRNASSFEDPPMTQIHNSTLAQFAVDNATFCPRYSCQGDDVSIPQGAWTLWIRYSPFETIVSQEPPKFTSMAREHSEAIAVAYCTRNQGTLETLLASSGSARERGKCLQPLKQFAARSGAMRPSSSCS